MYKQTFLPMDEKSPKRNEWYTSYNLLTIHFWVEPSTCKEFIQSKSNKMQRVKIVLHVSITEVRKHAA
jgi:hypothetical protein